MTSGHASQTPEVVHTISDAEVSALLDYPSVEEVLATAFEDLRSGQASIVARQRVDCAGVKFSSMGAIWARRGVAGVKSYPTIDGKFGFLTTIFDLDQNAPSAQFPGSELTRFRTAAMALLAARRLAASPLTKVALFGFGVQGRSVAEAICGSLSPESLFIVDPAANEQEILALGRRHGVTTVLARAESATRGAALVITATRSKTPVFDGSWVESGTSVVALGTSLPGGTELDLTLLRRADRFIVEWKPQSLLEAGEIVMAHKSGCLTGKTLVDLTELSTHLGWRKDPREVVIFKSVGVGLSDVAAAWLAHSRL